MRRARVLLAAALACCCAAAAAQPSPRVMEREKTLHLRHPRLATALQRRSLASATPRLPAAGLVQVRIRLKKGSPLTPDTLKAAGLTNLVSVAGGHVVEGWIAPERLDELAALTSVRFVGPALPAITRSAGSGSVVSEGVALLGADRLQALGATGAGIRVGVISDGVSGMQTAQNKGDLPASVTVVKNSCRSNCAEGTAMLEIVHDLAPGAMLGFCGPRTLLEMEQCVTSLAGSFHADIIVDDLAFYDEPAFEDGSVAQAIDAQAAKGLLYVTAAGNSYGCYYEADYQPAAYDSTTYDSVHDFGSGSGYEKVVISPGYRLQAVLQWNDPFDSSSNDYDLFATDSSGNLLQSSTDLQDGRTAPAMEYIDLQNTSLSPREVHLSVARKAGAAARRFKLYLYDGSSGCQGLAEIAHSTTTGDISGHAAAAGAISVAAIDAFDTGGSQPKPESFSSAGPVRVDFPAMEIRAKPDIAGVDNVSISGAGGFGYSGGGADECPRRCFRGTSAAAPHVAAVLALLKGNFLGDFRQAITATAVAGDDSDRLGAGMVDAYAAAASLSRAPVAAILQPAGDITLQPGQPQSFEGSCADPQSLAASYAWSLGPLGSRDSLSPGTLAFPEAGSYTVTFACTGAFGQASNVVSRTITVSGEPYSVDTGSNGAGSDAGTGSSSGGTGTGTGNSSGQGGGSGGGGGTMDPAWLLVVGIAAWRRRQRQAGC